MSPSPTRAAPRLGTAEALHRLLDRLDPGQPLPVLLDRLASTLGTLLGGAPVAIFRPETRLRAYVPIAQAHLPVPLAPDQRLDPQDLPLDVLSSPAAGAAAPIRLRRTPAALAPFVPRLAVALHAGGERPSVVLIGARPDRRAYRAADLAQLGLLVAAAGPRLAAAALGTADARHRLRLQTLHRLGEELSGNLDVEAICRAVYEHLCTVLQVDSCFIARYDDERHLLVFPFCIDAGERYSVEPQPPGGGLASWILEHQQPLVIEDLLRDLRDLAIPERPDRFGTMRPSRSWMGVPMVAQHRTVGVLSVHAYEPGLYREEQVQFLSTVANQVAGALENARLVSRTGTALATRAGQLAALEEIARVLNSGLDLDRVIQLVVAHAVEASGAAGGIMALYDAPRQALRLLGQIGYSAEVRRQNSEMPLPIRRGIIGRAVRENRSLLVTDVAADPDYIEILPGVQSQLVTLVSRGSEVLGLISLESRDPAGFGPEQRDFIEHLAEHAAIAIGNARLFADQRRSLRDLTSLQDLGLALTANLNITTLLEEAVRAAVRLLDATSSGVLLVDEARVRVANVRCWRRPDNRLEIGTYESVVRPGGLTDTVLRTGQGVIVADSESDPRVNPVTRGEGIRSLVAVPIRATHATLGVLFANAAHPQAFGTAEQQLLQIFANQVAVAVQNARLFDERRAFERRLVAENARMGRELMTARATQRRLLPTLPAEPAGLAVHGLCLPAMEVGGDYFDVLPLADGRVALAIADVTGKGTSAVMLMAMIKTALIAQVAADPRPEAVIAALNTLAVELMHGQLVTFFYALYDPEARRLAYGNAGHLYPYVRRAGGALESLETGDLPLGAALLLDPGAATVTLAPGDLLVLFSDGIVEATDAAGRLFSFDRLEGLLAAADPAADPRLLVEDIVDRVHSFAGGAPQDDATLLVARVE